MSSPSSKQPELLGAPCVKNRNKRSTRLPRKKVSIIAPTQHVRSYGTTRDYKHLCGHSVAAVTKQLPDQPVLCWFNSQVQTLNECALLKFVKEQQHCKRCSLFQGDEHSTTLRNLIQEWEKDEVIK